MNNLAGLVWNESCVSFVYHRYAHDSVDVVSHMTRVIVSRLLDSLQSEDWDYPVILNWIVRFFTLLHQGLSWLLFQSILHYLNESWINDLIFPVDQAEVDLLLQIVCDWRIWQVVTESGALNFLVSAVHHSALKLLDSQLWLLGDSLTWLSTVLDVDCSLPHLAVQLVSVLKPYAGNIGSCGIQLKLIKTVSSESFMRWLSMIQKSLFESEVVSIDSIDHWGASSLLMLYSGLAGVALHFQSTGNEIMVAILISSLWKRWQKHYRFEPN